MEFTLEYTRSFVAIFIVLALALSVILFALSGIGYVLRWMGRGKKAPAPAKTAKPEAARPSEAKAMPTGARAAAAPAPAKLPAMPAMRPGMPPLRAGSAKYTFAGNAAKLDIRSGKGHFGTARLGEEWEGASLITLSVAPQEGGCMLELRPMKARPVGVICSIVECKRGVEVGAVGTLHAEEGWKTAPPKPVYGSDMELALQFEDIEATDGLLGASLVAGGKMAGRIARVKDGWELAFERREGMPDDMIIIICAAQLIAEQAEG